MAINIADVKEYRKLTHRELTDDFVALAKSRGWKLVETLKLELSVMQGTRKKQTGTHKHEPIFVFMRK
ncbi:MAG: hypothetical protein WB869_00655 [Candidatus Acidiferrales bacterium]